MGGWSGIQGKERRHYNQKIPQSGVVYSISYRVYSLAITLTKNLSRVYWDIGAFHALEYSKVLTWSE